MNSKTQSRLKLPKSKRLRQSSLFREAMNSGIKKVSPFFILFYKEKSDIDQIGFVTGKKLGNAVVRNKIRRRLKESFRINQFCLRKKILLVFIGRKRTYNAPWHEINDEMKAVLSGLESD